MSNNEKLRTEDIIEILDSKIITSDGHPSIGVIPREAYSSVLTKISAQILTVDQKAAFDATYTAPSASNPVVLKHDLETYIPQADLGSVRDSVEVKGLLPLPAIKFGNTAAGSNIVTFIGGGVLTWGKRGDSIVGGSLPTGTVISDLLSNTTLLTSAEATATATGVSFTVGPVVGDLRGVIADSIIWRWNGTLWAEFTRTGTMLHTELINQNGDAGFQHITQDQLTGSSGILTWNHYHSNKAILDNILDAGSGEIITATERGLLPTSGQKAALVGTSGTPSASNPYITHLDSRLDTVRNPYVTVGPPGSLATFQGVDYRPFNDAIFAVDQGAAATVKAIEILAGTYDLSSVPIVWAANPSSLLLEGFTPATVILKFQTGVANPGIKVQGTGGPVIIRGLVIKLNAQGTSGIMSTRENTLIEDCIFEPGTQPNIDQIGVTLLGAGSIVRRCKFRGSLTKGVEIKAPNCRIESCVFDLTLATNYAVDIFSGADYSLVDHNFITSGTARVQSGVNYVNLTNNRLSSLTAITDLGTSTRYLENQPEDINQPFIGRKRTVGPLGTYADYRGSTEASIVAALADPNVTEVEILEGTYTISSTVVVPEGKALRGVRQGLSTSVVLLGAAGVQPLQLSNWSRLENLEIEGSNTSLVTGASISNATITHCGFNLTATTAATQYELSFSAPTDCLINNCFFKGQRGVYLYGGSTRTRLLTSVFTNADLSLTMDTAITNQKDHIKDNHFITTTAPAIAGNILLVENNHFLGLLPTKLQTLNSIWQGNWPHRAANNDSGVDTLDISLDRYLEPSSDGVVRSFIASSGTISFAEDQIGIAATLPIALPAKLNKLLPYIVKIYWTAENGHFGESVVWQVTAVFRDSALHRIGTAVSWSATATRGQPDGVGSESLEDVVILPSYTSYGLSSDPTHVSFIVERLGTSVSDTLTANAHLLEVQVLLPRD